MKITMTSFVLGLLLLGMTGQLTAQTTTEQDILFPIDLHEPSGSPTVKNNSPNFQFAQSTKQRLDSLTFELYDSNTAQWKDNRKETFSYDANENTTNHTHYIEDGNSGILVPDRNYEYEYDANQYSTLYHHSDWDIALQQWVTANRNEYENDANGNVTLATTYRNWNPTTGLWSSGRKSEYYYNSVDQPIERITYSLYVSTGQWVSDQKYDYAYDANGNEALILTSNWNVSTQTWEDNRKIEYTYNANNTLIQSINYIKNNTASPWEEFSKTDYSYDANGNLILRISWNFTLGQWEENIKNEYEYDGANNEINRTIYLWEAGEWVNFYKNVKAYNINGKPTLFEFYVWDVYTQQWSGEVKQEYSYDANNNHVLLNSFTPNNINFQWANDYRQNFNYDNTYPYNQLILPFTEFSFQHKRTDYTQDTWDATTEQWIQDTGRGTYYYSEQLVGIENIVEAGIHVFPNPAQDEVIFDLKNTSSPSMIELYDAQGRLADVQTLNNNKISVRHLNAGVYFYQLFHGAQQYGGRLIVR